MFWPWNTKKEKVQYLWHFLFCFFLLQPRIGCPFYRFLFQMICGTISGGTDYGRLERKSPSLNSRKSTPTPKLPKHIFLPHWPKFSDFFDLCLHWVSVVRAHDDVLTPCRVEPYMTRNIVKQLNDARKSADNSKNKYILNMPKSFFSNFSGLLLLYQLHWRVIYRVDV